MRTYLKIVWESLLLVSYLIFSYYYFNGWWWSSIGTIFILIFSYLIWRKDFLKVIGLKLTTRAIIKTVALTVLLIFGSFLMIRYIGSAHGVEIKFTGFRNYYHSIFYVLNEEIVLGAIAIYILIDRYRIKPYLASAGLAILFSVVHFVFYKWVFSEGGIIELRTLLTLFMVGFVRNNLIIFSRHIGYSWAMHFAWMVIMFGCKHFWIETNIKLTEPERFNLFLGANEMIIISSVLACISIFYFRKRKINFFT